MCSCNGGGGASGAVSLRMRRFAPLYQRARYLAPAISYRYGNLTVGDRDATTNNSVTATQRRLAELGYLPSSGVDGQYGPATRDAVRRFQTNNPPARVDGITGQETARLLFTQAVRDANGQLRPAPTATTIPETTPANLPPTPAPNPTPTPMPNAPPTGAMPAGWVTDTLARLAGEAQPPAQPTGAPTGAPDLSAGTCSNTRLAELLGYLG